MKSSPKHSAHPGRRIPRPDSSSIPLALFPTARIPACRKHCRKTPVRRRSMVLPAPRCQNPSGRRRFRRATTIPRPYRFAARGKHLAYLARRGPPQARSDRSPPNRPSIAPTAASARLPADAPAIARATTSQFHRAPDRASRASRHCHLLFFCVGNRSSRLRRFRRRIRVARNRHETIAGFQCQAQGCIGGRFEHRF